MQKSKTRKSKKEIKAEAEEAYEDQAKECRVYCISKQEFIDAYIITYK